MEDVVDKGLAMSIGVSNFNQQQIKNIIQTCKIPPAVLQVFTVVAQFWVLKNRHGLPLKHI